MVIHQIVEGVGGEKLIAFGRGHGGGFFVFAPLLFLPDLINAGGLPQILGLPVTPQGSKPDGERPGQADQIMKRGQGKRIRGVRFVDSIIKSASGKILRRKMKERI